MSLCACLQHLLNIHFHAPALGAALLAKDEGASPDMATSAGRCRAAMLYFVFNADVVAVLVAHDLRVGEFVAQACPSGYCSEPHTHVMCMSVHVCQADCNKHCKRHFKGMHPDRAQK